jgi:hypothetical protein
MSCLRHVNGDSYGVRSWLKKWTGPNDGRRIGHSFPIATPRPVCYTAHSETAMCIFRHFIAVFESLSAAHHDKTTDRRWNRAIATRKSALWAAIDRTCTMRGIRLYGRCRGSLRSSRLRPRSRLSDGPWRMSLIRFRGAELHIHVAVVRRREGLWPDVPRDPRAFRPHLGPGL